MRDEIGFRKTYASSFREGFPTLSVLILGITTYGYLRWIFLAIFKILKEGGKGKAPSELNNRVMKLF